MRNARVFDLPRAIIFSAALLGTGCSPAETPKKEIESLLATYFSTWSDADWKGYGQLFHLSSTIYFLDDRNHPVRVNLPRFLAHQAEFHSRSKVPPKEMPTDIRIDANDRLGRAEVDYELTAGKERTTGVDYFTVIRTPEGWRILSLVFYKF